MATDYSWYILKVRGGKEKEIIEEIKNILRKNDCEKSVKELKIINKEIGEKKIFSGHVFCHCLLNNQLVELLYSVPRVIGFLNHKKNEDNLPKPLSYEQEEELLYLLQKKKKITSAEHPKDFSFEVNDLVKIIQGNFTACQGKVLTVDQQKKTLTIEINFFAGRSTPVEVAMKDCVK